MKKPYFKIQFFSILALLIVVMIQGFTHLVNMKPLEGFSSKREKVDLNFKTYYNGTYQSYLTSAAKQNTGFREFFIRNYNQVSYSLFNKVNNNTIVKGLNGELYLNMYLRDLTGERLIQEYETVEQAKAVAQKNVEATMVMIDSLRQHGTSFLYIFAPTKTSVYPEHLPTYYKKHIADFSLEEYYIELFKQYNIPHIDFYTYFKSIKNTFPYPLFARTGTHWAQSTIPFVSDSILRKLEEITNYHFPSIEYVDPNPTTNYVTQDAELEGTMNLLFPLSKPALPRPVYRLTDTIGKDRPKLLVIGDSFYVQIKDGCFSDAFSEWNYWKYNRDVRSSKSEYHFKPLDSLLQAPNVLRDADILIGVFTAPFHYQYFCGFLDDYQELYAKGPLKPEDFIDLVIQDIKSQPKWYQSIVNQSEKNGLSIEENLRRNALFTINNSPKIREKYGIQ